MLGGRKKGWEYLAEGRHKTFQNWLDVFLLQTLCSSLDSAGKESERSLTGPAGESRKTAKYRKKQVGWLGL